MKHGTYILVLLVSALFLYAEADAAGGSALPKVGGVLGVSSPLEEGCIAVWVEVPDDKAISGVKWYNNDGSVAFPGLFVQSGKPGKPVDLPDAAPVALDVQGASNAWSEVSFTQEVGSHSGGLYVIFRLPADLAATGRGSGGGPALGYTSAGAGAPGWISPDGLEWEPLHPHYGFAVQPVYVDGSGDILLKSAERPEDSTHGDEAGSQAPRVYPTTLHPAYPNPFNPQTVLRYSLKSAGMVDLSVFSVRGERLRTLVSEPRDPGEYEVTWDGRDRSGRQLASGVYFAKFSAGTVSMTQRLVLLQ